MADRSQTTLTREEQAAREAEFKAQLEAALAAEQAAGATTSAEQAARVERAQQDLEAINRRIDAVKAEINQYRREIKAEQQRYERLPLAQRVSLLPQLEKSTKQRLERIANLEAKSTALHADQWQAVQGVEVARFHLEVLRQAGR
ncbi:MAG: hypothetical protein HGA45_21750 [Chloroflexales bacterium]|nr:hypothetical protein [Chloroflexales bacterium]